MSPTYHAAPSGNPLRRPRWTAFDEQLLEREYGRTDTAAIARRLHRSLTAVKLKAYRLGLSSEGAEPRYSRDELAAGLGVTVYRVRRWVDAGQLRSEPHGGFRRAAIRRFLLAHPGEISLAQVSAEWFLSLIMEQE